MKHASTKDMFLGFEQLEVVRDLLLSESPVKARMALILLDGLADAMLSRRLADLYEASEDPVRRRLGNLGQYTSKARLLARQRFNRRVELARQRIPSYFGGDEEWLSANDADVLKVCHTYRNAAYHQDAHNPNVIASIGRLHYAVVARLFAHLQPSGLSRGPTSTARIEQLAQWGYDTGPMLNTREAADAVADHLVGQLPVHPPALREVFADDLEERVESLRDDVRFLADSTIVDPAEIVERMELSAHYSADEELLALQEEVDVFWLVDPEESGVTRDEMIEQVQRGVSRIHERMTELAQEHKQRVTLGLIDQGGRTAEQLTRMSGTDTTQVLLAYHRVDRPLSELEGYVQEAVVLVDREIERQSDLERGK